ncbi:MAG TPA: TadA family conjugal transfer-associated ATPase [Propionibacteriaceae bacterium]|nr:TadA family conjugal transfer-associated ATPase [Propionibacteriaceae bacterium]
MNTAEWEAVRARIAILGREPDAADIGDALRWCGQVVSDASVLAVSTALHRDSVGAGPLEPLLRLPGVTDVLVNGPDDVYVDTGDGLRRVGVRFDSDEQVRRLAVRLAASVGRRLDDASPFVDARMADGTRVHAILGGLADVGTCLSLRIPARSRLSLDDWVTSGTCHPEVAHLLRRIVTQKVAFLVSGGTGSGKTTLLASLLGLVPPTERILVVEDSRELAPEHPHCVRLEGRASNAEGAGAVTMTQLVRQALRMRPDRIVVGEVRGAELVDLLIALNTGHEGGCGTVHANTPESVPARLEALAALGGLGREAAHSQIAAAVRAVVHVTRDAGGRRVSGVALLARGPAGFVEARSALEVSGEGRLRRLEGLPELESILAVR